MNERSSGDRTVTVEVWSDLVCPWCYLGRARLGRALAAFPHGDQVQLVHRSFELDPQFPRGQSMPVREMLADKYGMSLEDAKAANDRIADLAAAEGLPFAAERSAGNTFDAHRLLQFAAGADRQQAVLGRLYDAQFGESQRSIFDPAGLLAIAVDAGLDEVETEQVLAGDSFTEAVRGDERGARQLGITGVPFAVADGRLAVSGAQPKEMFARLLQAAWDGEIPGG